jgi:hypothetical protein
MKNVCPPVGTAWRTSHSIQAGPASRIGDPVRPSWYGKPFIVRATSSTSTGLVSLRTMARSSRSMVPRLNAPPPAIRRWVSASCSTPIPTSLGSKATWVAQLSTIMLRRSTPSTTAREPTA